MRVYQTSPNRHFHGFCIGVLPLFLFVFGCYRSIEPERSSLRPDASIRSPLDTEIETDKTRPPDTDTYTDDGTTDPVTDWGSELETDSIPFSEAIFCNDFVPTSLFNSRGRILDMVVDRHNAYVAYGPGGFAVFDMEADVAHIAHIVDVGDTVVSVWVEGNIAYALCENMGLKIIQLGGEPEIIGEFGPIEGGRSLAMFKGHIYALSQTGLYGFNVADPATPILLGAIEDVKNGMVIEVTDDRLVLGAADGIHYYDEISSQLIEQQSILLSRGIFSLDAVDGRIYAVNGRLLYIVDMESATVLSRLHFKDGIFNVRVDGDVAYGVTTSGLSAVDVSDPRAPRHSDVSLYVNDKAFGEPPAVQIEGTELYLYTPKSIYRTSTLNLEQLAPRLMSTTDHVLGQCTPIDLSTAYLYATCTEMFTSTLLILDIQGGVPKVISTLELPEVSEMRIRTDRSLAFALTHYDGLYVIDISSPALPSVIHIAEPVNQTHLALSDTQGAMFNSGASLIKLFDLAASKDGEWVPFYFPEGVVKLTGATIKDRMLWFSAFKDDRPILIGVNTADIENPTVMVSLETDEPFGQLIADEKQLYALSDTAVYGFSMAADSSLMLDFSLEVSLHRSSGFFNRMALWNGILNIEDHTRIDVRDPNDIRSVSIDISEDASRTVVANEHGIVWGGPTLYGGEADAVDAPTVSWKFMADTFFTDIAMVDEYAYVTDGGALNIFNMSDGFHPIHEGSIPLDGHMKHIASRDSYLFVTAAETGLTIFDISNPIELRPVGQIETAFGDAVSAPVAVGVDGDNVYIGDATGGLVVVDVAEPSMPGIVFHDEQYGDRQMALDAAASTLHLSTENYWRIFDIKDPAQPILTHEIQTPRWTTPLVNGGFVYMSDDRSLSTYTLQIVDAPRLLGRMDKSSDGVLVQEKDSLFLLGNRLEKYDVSTPAEPVFQGALRSVYGNFIDGAVVDGIGYLLANGRLMVVNTDQRSAEIELQPIFSNHALSQIEKLDENTLVALDEHRLRVIDISTPYHPMETAVVEVSGEYLLVSHGYAFVGPYDPGIQIVDLTKDPPLVVGHIDQKESGARLIAYSGEQGYLMTDHQLMIFDLSDITEPKALGRLELEGKLIDGERIGDRVYLSTWEGDLTVVDVSRFDNLQVVGTIETQYGYRHLSSDQEHLFGVRYDDAFETLLLDDPDMPTVAATLPVLGTGDISIEGPFAYISRSASGLEIIDLSDVQAPRVHSRLYSADYTADAVVEDGIVYIADGTGGVSVFDVGQGFAPLDQTVLLESGVTAIGQTAGDIYALKDGHDLAVFDADSGEPKSSVWSSEAIISFAADDDAIFCTTESDLFVTTESDTMVHPLPTTSTAFRYMDAAYGRLAYQTDDRGVGVVLNDGGILGNLDDGLLPAAISGTPRGVTILNTDWVVAASTDLGNNTSQISVIDIHDVTQPRKIVARQFKGEIVKMVSVPPYLYVGLQDLNHTHDKSAPNGITILNLEEPADPDMIGVVPFDEPVFDIAVANDRLVAAHSIFGFSLYDIFNPLSPQKITAVNLEAGAEKIETNGAFAFVVTLTGDLISIDMHQCNEFY